LDYFFIDHHNYDDHYTYHNMKIILLFVLIFVLSSCTPKSVWEFSSSKDFEYKIEVGDYTIIDKTDYLKLKLRNTDTVKVQINQDQFIITPFIRKDSIIIINGRK